LINQVKQINQQVFSQDHHVSSFRKRSSVKWSYSSYYICW
jgi:hypothetical protein